MLISGPKDACARATVPRGQPGSSWLSVSKGPLAATPSLWRYHGLPSCGRALASPGGATARSLPEVWTPPCGTANQLRAADQAVQTPRRETRVLQGVRRRALSGGSLSPPQWRRGPGLRLRATRGSRRSGQPRVPRTRGWRRSGRLEASTAGGSVDVARLGHRPSSCVPVLPYPVWRGGAARSPRCWPPRPMTESVG